MLDYSFPDFIGQVQSLAISFKDINDAQALLIMLKTARIYLTKNFFTCMSKRCMSQIMAERYGLGEVFI